MSGSGKRMQGDGGKEEVEVGERKGSEEGNFPDPVPSLHLEPNIALLPERGCSPLFPSPLHPCLFSF